MDYQDYTYYNEHREEDLSAFTAELADTHTTQRMAETEYRSQNV